MTLDGLTGSGKNLLSVLLNEEFQYQTFATESICHTLLSNAIKYGLDPQDSDAVVQFIDQIKASAKERHYIESSVREHHVSGHVHYYKHVKRRKKKMSSMSIGLELPPIKEFPNAVSNEMDSEQKYEQMFGSDNAEEGRSKYRQVFGYEKKELDFWAKEPLLGALNRLFSRMAHAYPLILTGRYISASSVFPDVDYKFFLESDLYTRNQRRTNEIRSYGAIINKSDEMPITQERDGLYLSRPKLFQPAEDVIKIDANTTSYEVLALIKKHIPSMQQFE